MCIMIQFVVHLNSFEHCNSVGENGKSIKCIQSSNTIEECSNYQHIVMILEMIVSDWTVYVE